MNQQKAITYFEDRGNQYMALALKHSGPVANLLRRKASHAWQLSALIERMSAEQYQMVLNAEAGLPNAVAA